ncbi:MAG: glycosyltransferase family 2 protein [Candidatus Eremiobacteraeota bacterium]|nr:glycosyltransferase family 2 protein [Candidatus Eremiobacteraeota bacterium]MBV9055386.1 glycosyltransferase family 2 protein [Candidatus Eremiobacteraeota bacterium]MBV9700193.1 glycosyltransferase family 2 protein [Candidatus Eremiobacteraeota bacterium]
MTTVTVVIPAYNEGLAFAGALAAIADEIASYKAAPYDFRYLIVDDGSTDETYELACRFARWRNGVRVLRHEKNRGLGGALRTAFAEIDTELAVVLDADLSYSTATALSLIEHLEREGADIALASAYAHGGAVRNVPWIRRILSREANRILSLATGGRYATITCMVRAYRTDVLRRLPFRSDTMDAVAEQLLSAMRAGMRVVEVPATLEWTPERRQDTGRLRASTVARRIGMTLSMGLRHRPALWLAMPGLFPGLLPIVVAIALALRVNTKTLAIVTAVTVAIQYGSLALFGGQLTAFFARKFTQRHHRNGAPIHGYKLPSRSA